MFFFRHCVPANQWKREKGKWKRFQRTLFVIHRNEIRCRKRRPARTSGVTQLTHTWQWMPHSFDILLKSAEGKMENQKREKNWQEMNRDFDSISFLSLAATAVRRRKYRFPIFLTRRRIHRTTEKLCQKLKKRILQTDPSVAQKLVTFEWNRKDEDTFTVVRRRKEGNVNVDDSIHSNRNGNLFLYVFFVFFFFRFSFYR